MMLGFIADLSTNASLLLIVCLLAVCVFEAINGFHDTANAVATVIYTKTLPPVFAVIWSGMWNFLGAMFGGIAVAATRAARNAIVPLWAEAIGLDATSTSIVFGLSGAADMLLFYPAGWAMDRFGRVYIAVPSMLVLGLGMVLVPFASTFWALVVVATVLGIGNGIGSGILMTLGADASPEVGRAQFLGGWRLMGDIGWASGPALVSAVAVLASLGTASVVMGVVAWAGAAWLKVWVPRFDPIRPGRSALGSPALDSQAPSSSASSPERSTPEP